MQGKLCHPGGELALSEDKKARAAEFLERLLAVNGVTKNGYHTAEHRDRLCHRTGFGYAFPVMAGRSADVDWLQPVPTLREINAAGAHVVHVEHGIPLLRNDAAGQLKGIEDARSVPG